MKKLIFLGILVASSVFGVVSAEQRVLRGTHFDMDYEFAMSEEYEDVQGSWGESRYNLIWDPYDLILEGSTAGERQLLEVDAQIGVIRLTSYCGWGDLQYTASSPSRVWGTLCLQDIDKSFANFEEAQVWMKSELLSRIVADFPEPVRAEIQAFLAGLLRF